MHRVTDVFLCLYKALDLNRYLDEALSPIYKCEEKDSFALRAFFVYL